MNQPDFFDQYVELRSEGQPFVCVTLVDAIGSTPQDAGSKMLVNENGIVAGTVGGGRIEARAIEEAKKLLKDETQSNLFFEWNLQKDIGMTCGGVVKVFLEKENFHNWSIVIFGAGHIAKSLTRLLLTLPCKITCVDPRGEWLSKLPNDPRVQKVHLDNPVSYVTKLKPTDFVICMTKGHATDFPILLELYKTKKETAYLGVIGSKSKAAVLRKELSEEGISKDQADFTCPLGLPIGTNHPGEIAVSIAAQLLEVRDRIKRPAK